MAKDPAFLFYSSDFLTGVQDLTMEERGQYITLLCVQHQKGHLSNKLIQLLCHGNATADVLHKFSIDSDGLYFNERLEVEISKRKEHSDKQRDRALAGWEKRKKDDATAYTTADATALPLENENENEILGKEKERGVGKEKERDFGLFTPAIERWLSYKKERKESYKTEDSIQVMARKLKKMANDNPATAMEIVEQSMGNNYAGLFPLKQNGNVAATPQPTSEKPAYKKRVEWQWVRFPRKIEQGTPSDFELVKSGNPQEDFKILREYYAD